MTLRDNPPPVLTFCFVFFVACLLVCLFVSFFVHVHMTCAIARCTCSCAAHVAYLLILCFFVL